MFSIDYSCVAPRLQATTTSDFTTVFISSHLCYDSRTRTVNEHFDCSSSSSSSSLAQLSLRQTRRSVTSPGEGWYHKQSIERGRPGVYCYYRQRRKEACAPPPNVLCTAKLATEHCCSSFSSHIALTRVVLVIHGYSIGQPFMHIYISRETF